MNKKQLKKVLAQSEFDIQNAIASVLALDFCFGSYTNGHVIPEYTYQYVFSYIDTATLKPFYQIIQKKDIEISNKIYRVYMKNPRSLDLFRSRQEELKEKIDKNWEEYKELKEDKISADFNRIFKDFIRYSVMWWKYACVLEDKGEVINRMVVPKFQARHNLSESEAQRVINVLAHPKESAIYNSERKDFLNICLEIAKQEEKNRQSKSILKLLANYREKYFWFASTFFGAGKISNGSITRRAKDEIKKTGLTGIMRELRSNRKKIKGIEVERQKLLGKMSFSLLDKKETLFSQKIFSLVDFRKMVMMSIFYYFFIMAEDIAKSFKMDYREISFYTLRDIFNLLEKGERLKKGEIARRQKEVFFAYEKNKPVKMFFGEEARGLLEIVAPKNFSEEVKGTVASVGDNSIVRGRVRIINNPEKEKFLDGEILITSMTRVEFVPLMHKAKAIITNEGGMACHAAIVAREMNKPCITGTKVATYSFKNGDEVEIDLKKGVVKKIE
ncbi:MAG: PEP-utilizing enzyme [Patescibacteria group bacterium]